MGRSWKTKRYLDFIHRTRKLKRPIGQIGEASRKNGKQGVKTKKTGTAVGHWGILK